MIIANILMAIFGLFVVLVVSILLTAITGLGTLFFVFCVASQISLFFWGKHLIKKGKTSSRKGFKLSKIWDNIKKKVDRTGWIKLLVFLGGSITAAYLVRPMVGWVPFLGSWTIPNFTTTFLGLCWIWETSRHRRLNWVELTIRILMVFSICAVLAYTSKPYEQIGDYFIKNKSDETPHLSVILQFLGGYEPAINTLNSSAEWFTTFIFGISTSFQVASWKLYGKLNNRSEKNFLVTGASAFYILETVLAYSEYPFMTQYGSAISLASLTQSMVSFFKGGTLDLLDIYPDPIKLMLCVSSVILLDFILVHLWSDTKDVDTTPSGQTRKHNKPPQGTSSPHAQPGFDPFSGFGGQSTSPRGRRQNGRKPRVKF